MLGTRLLTGISMVVALLAILSLDEWMAPWFPLWLVLSLIVCALASLELIGLLNATSARPSGNAVFGGVMALVLANWAPHLSAETYSLPQFVGRAAFDPLAPDPLAPVHALAWPLMAFIGVFMVTFIAQSVQFEKPGATMATIAGTTLGVAYVGLLGSFIIQTRWLGAPYHGLIPVVCLFATAKGADTGAYTVGRLAGRHKLWPKLSPNKTIEGAVGGLAFGVLFTLIVTAIARFVLGVPSLGWRAAVGYGLLIGTAAQLGDLMESMIKRDCARKDASDAVPGFGGVLDVLDSPLFAAPVAFGYWLVFGP
jgi:phosphatidate cytidylyltransferase